MRGAPPSSYAALASATATMGVANFAVMSVPLAPEPGLHPDHHYHYRDIFVPITFGIAAAAMYPLTRTIVERLWSRDSVSVDIRDIL